eukprot:CAMPEP_0114341030 /NCGR_PEP_ID=MMETSP0101-20121206/8770_1 /TAXON_ID=38822 ORGANISM="Pteridomonas danica, Strain PT" /NCGR_SAMPLE_ID=MMETSP0101 /ASSEMBLY_ACC=CAM_ASM_000211 /LENGTH=316 /DNA_ID=CAMNT_0001474487 /DNA_START=217 /DNA_END=1167 /DNA_ORIENTATION=+
MAISATDNQVKPNENRSIKQDIKGRPKQGLPSEYSYHLSLPNQSSSSSSSSSSQSSVDHTSAKQQQQQGVTQINSSPWSPAAWSSGTSGSGKSSSSSGYSEIVDGVFGVGVASMNSNTSTDTNKENKDYELYSKMLQATNSYEGHLVQEKTINQDSYLNPIGGKLCTPQTTSQIDQNHSPMSYEMSQSHYSHFSQSQSHPYSSISSHHTCSYEHVSNPNPIIHQSLNDSSTPNQSDGVYRPSSSTSKTSLFAAMGNKLRNYGSIEKGYRSLHSVPENKEQDQVELEDVEPKFSEDDYRAARDPVDVICNPECCQIS